MILRKTSCLLFCACYVVNPAIANPQPNQPFNEQRTSVGYYRNNNNNIVPLGYYSSNGGASWSLSHPFPLPTDVAANGSQHCEVVDIQCNGAQRLCTAVGFYLTNNRNIMPMIYLTSTSGINWSLGYLPYLPDDVAGNGAQNNQFRSVACDLTGSQCSAVGFYLNNNNNLAPLSYTSSNGGITWNLSPRLPLPFDVASKGAQDSELLNVICDGNGHSCSAIGFYRNTNNNITPLAYTSGSGGAGWTLSNRFPLPNDSAANGIQNTQLKSINCDNNKIRCSSVGFYLTNNNNVVPLSYTTIDGGITWALSARLPLPSDVAAQGIQDSKLQSIVCNQNGTLCKAVGSYRSNNNNVAPLGYISSNGGASWSLSNPFMQPANKAANGIQNSSLQNLTCINHGYYCSAVGAYLTSSNNHLPLSYISVNGGLSWVLSADLPYPANIAAMGAQNSVLLGID